MAARWDFSPILFFMVLLLHNLSISIAADTDATSSSSIDFIRTSCNNHTRYPDICYVTLSIHANAIKNNNLERLAWTALYVSRDVAKGAATHIFDLRSKKGGDVSGDVVMALDDCLSSFKSATSLIGNSMKQMRNLRANNSSSQEAFAFQMGNVQTWTSAALTDEDTCLSSFKEANGGTFRTVVEESKMVTSNALALVNLYVSSRR